MYISGGMVLGKFLPFLSSTGLKGLPNNVCVFTEIESISENWSPFRPKPEEKKQVLWSIKFPKKKSVSRKKNFNIFEYAYIY